MLIDCGAGTTEVAIISLGSICLSRSVRIGGDTLDEMIVNHIRARYHFEIGLRTAEKVKLELAALDKAADPGGRMIDVSGKDRHGGLHGRLRSEERRVGKEGDSTCRSGWWAVQ